MKTKLIALIMTVLMSSMAYGYAYSDYEWTTYNGHQYAITLDFSDWTQAETWAVEVGGHLVTINDEAENTWVAELIKDSYVIPVPPYPNLDPHANLAWIGLEYKGSGDMALPDSWRWTSSEPITFWNPYTGYSPFPAPNYGIHMQMLGANHDWGPGQWNNNAEHDLYLYPRGVIELPTVIPAPGALILGTTGVGFVGWLRRRKAV